MVRYKQTYQRYIALMNQLRMVIDSIIGLTPDSRRKMLAIEIVSAIDTTKKTAEAEINMPSSELLGITQSVINLKNCGATPISPVLELWNKSLKVLLSAIENLSGVAEDSYLISAKGLIREQLEK